MEEELLTKLEYNNEQVIQLRQQGQYQAALVIALKSYQLAQAHLDSHHPLYASVESHLAILYVDTANYAAAEPLLKEVVELWRLAVGEHDEIYAQSLNNLADLYL